MKTSFFVKAAVVAMAAFGAFSFNGNTEKQAPVFIHDGDMCRSIELPCSELGDVRCKYQLGSNQIDVWSDFQCSKEAFYTN